MSNPLPLGMSDGKLRMGMFKTRGLEPGLPPRYPHQSERGKRDFRTKIRGLGGILVVAVARVKNKPVCEGYL